MAEQAVEHIHQELEVTSSYRWQHWIRAGSIVALIITGFYIADPYLTPVPNPEPTNFTNALFRSWHQIFGFILIGVFIFKSYLFVFARRHSAERAAIKDLINPKIWIQQIGYYLLITKHPKLKGIYNPLQFMGYFTFYLMLIGIILTGLIMYTHVYHEGLGGLLSAPMRPIEAMFGGIGVVRQVHHILMWGIMIFILGHIYMAIYNAIFSKEGGMDTIFSGLRWKKDDH